MLGFGLLGLLMTDLTGASFGEVLESRVFRPLGMEKAVVGLPAERLDDFAKCYVATGERSFASCEQTKLEVIAQGSGDGAVTAVDMTRFMNALLEMEAATRSGGSGARELLSPALRDEFLDFDQYRFHPDGPGLGLGIREYSRRGRRAFGHGGGISGFEAQMDLFPESSVGGFVALAGGPDQVYEARLSSLPRLLSPAPVAPNARRVTSLTTLFAEHFLPVAGPEEKGSDRVSRRATSAQDPAAESWAGYYVLRRYLSDALMVNLARLSVPLEVEAQDRDTLKIAGLGEFRRSGENRFEDSDGFWVAFRRTDRGSYLSFRGDPYGIYEREPFYTAPRFTLVPGLLALVLLPTAAMQLRSAMRVGRWAVGAGWWAGC